MGSQPLSTEQSCGERAERAVLGGGVAEWGARLEEEREQLGPAVVLQDARCQLAHRVAHLRAAGGGSRGDAGEAAALSTTTTRRDECPPEL